MQLDKATYLRLKDLIADLYDNYTYSTTDVEYLRDKLLAYERNEIVNELDINADIDIEIRDSKVDIMFR